MKTEQNAINCYIKHIQMLPGRINKIIEAYKDKGKEKIGPVTIEVTPYTRVGATGYGRTISVNDSETGLEYIITVQPFKGPGRSESYKTILTVGEKTEIAVVEAIDTDEKTTVKHARMEKDELCDEARITYMKNIGKMKYSGGRCKRPDETIKTIHLVGKVIEHLDIIERAVKIKEKITAHNRVERSISL